VIDAGKLEGNSCSTIDWSDYNEVKKKKKNVFCLSDETNKRSYSKRTKNILERHGRK
jgi:hypothetical protein